MAVMAHDSHHSGQTHAEVTRDVVNTLGTADRAYFIALGVAVFCFLVGVAKGRETHVTVTGKE